MQHSTQRFPCWQLSVGALFAGVSVGLAAYASHAADLAARAPLSTAAAFLFGHGVALIALAGVARGRLATMASVLLLAGTLLFSGALVARHLFGMGSTLAPYGGSLLMLGWLLHAIAAWRR